MKARRVALLFTLLVAGCGLFDSGVEWRHGAYGLLWIDMPNELSLSYDMGKGSWATIIEPWVFAVGANELYIVAKQHPRGDRSVTSYFIVEMQAGAPKANSTNGVTGPLTEKEFQAKAATMSLPQFSKILESLR